MMLVNVYARSEANGWHWQLVEMAVSPDTAANVMRSWGSRGWQAICLSEDCDRDAWDQTWPKPSAPKPRRTSAPRKPSAKTGWDDPEAKKVRAKTLNAINARVQKRGEVLTYNPYNTDAAVHAYAAALGVPPEDAAEKINFHNECLAVWQRSGGKVARP